MKYLIMMCFTFLYLILVPYAHGVHLTSKQKYIQYIAKTIGESTCTNVSIRKMCFGKTLQAIAWQESSYGINKIGDDGTSFGIFQVRLATAKRVIRLYKMKYFYILLEDDELLKSELLNNHWFSARIAAYYLKMNYEYGVRRDHWDPWILSVSRYNGGNFNRTYLNKIVQKIKLLS